MRQNFNPIRGLASLKEKEMPPIRPIRVNAPQLAVIDISQLTQLQSQSQPQAERYATGFKRYATCGTCKSNFKIFTCYQVGRDRDKSCFETGQGEEKYGETHTHFTCACGEMTFLGKVNITTKQWPQQAAKAK